MELVARWRAGGDAVDVPVLWQVYDAQRGPLGERILRGTSAAARGRVRLARGDYVVTAAVGETYVERDLTIDAPPAAPVELVLDAGRLALEAALASGAPSVTHALGWRAYASEAAARVGRGEQASAFASAPEFVLPAGRYVVTATDGVVTGRALVELRSGERVQQRVVLEAGELRLRAALTAGFPSIRQDVHWSIAPVEAAGEGHAAAAAEIEEFTPAPILRLPPGDYRVHARFGAAEGASRVTLDAGERKSLRIDLDAGLVRVSAALAPGGEPPGMTVEWSVTAAGEPEAPTVEDAAETRVFPLDAGDYRVRARADHAMGSAEVQVQPGRVHDLEVSLDAARVELEAITAGRAPADGPVRWLLFGGDPPRPLDRRESEIAVFVLPAGRYRVEAVGRDGRGERAFETHPGSRRRLQVELAR